MDCTDCAWSEVPLLPAGGKKKPLKQPKKQQQEMDEVKYGGTKAVCTTSWDSVGYRGLCSMLLTTHFKYSFIH